MTTRPAGRLFYNKDTPQELENAYLLDITRIKSNPSQPRRLRDAEKDRELAVSIQQQGIIEPLVVYADPTQPGDYVLIAGHRRLEAAELAGLTEVPVIVKGGLTPLEIRLMMAAENGQRADLDREDQGREYRAIMEDAGWSVREAAAQLGINKDFLAERVKALDRPDLLEQYRQGNITWKQVLAGLKEEVGPPADDGEGSGEDEGSEKPAAAFKDKPLRALIAWMTKTDVSTVPPGAAAGLIDQLNEAIGLMEQWIEELGGDTN